MFPSTPCFAISYPLPKDKSGIVAVTVAVLAVSESRFASLTRQYQLLSGAPAVLRLALLRYDGTKCVQSTHAFGTWEGGMPARISTLCSGGIGSTAHPWPPSAICSDTSGPN